MSDMPPYEACNLCIDSLGIKNDIKDNVKAMPVLMDALRNKLMHLENTWVMYGSYNVEI